MGTRIKATQLRTSSVSDLTNTTWIINNSPDVQVTMSEETYNITFTSNNSTFVRLGIVYDIGSDMGDGPLNQGLNYYYDSYSSDKVYNSRTNIWNNDAYKTIEITGGEDVTNSTLISWLQTNATQQTPPEPSGTNHTHLGSLSIIKKHFGDLEVIKETLNGVTIYEKGSPSPSLISFTIDIKSYQAEDGMTWAEWVNSVYNTDGFVNDGSVIVFNYVGAVTTSSSGYNYVSPSSTITANFAYYLRRYGG